MLARRATGDWPGVERDVFAELIRDCREEIDLQIRAPHPLERDTADARAREPSEVLERGTTDARSAQFGHGGCDVSTANRPRATVERRVRPIRHDGVSAMTVTAMNMAR
jgi:hypothetical protein